MVQTHARPGQPKRFFDTLIEIGERCLCSGVPGLKPAVARRLLSEVATKTQARHAGEEVYISSGHRQRTQLRDEAIRAAHQVAGPHGVSAGSTMRTAQLAQMHRLSVRRVRAILARAPNRG